MKKLKIGAVGLGRAFSLMVPAFRDPRIALVAAADPRAEARKQFERDFSARAFRTVEELCREDFDVLYIATPHQFHAHQARVGFSFGKHVLVEKPMALSLAECRGMVAAAKRARRHLIVGHSHSFDAPILHARRLIASGRYGRVRMITALDFTDFLYRPRRPEELDTRKGGGAVFNQAAHQVDIARLLAGSPVRSVRASAGVWDRSRPTEGAYSAFLTFASGASASLNYSGYAHFDSDEFMGWIGEMGLPKDARGFGFTRKALRGNELLAKNRRNYGGKDHRKVKTKFHQHFGVFIVSCEKADLRPLPHGVMIYANGAKRLEPLPPPRIARVEVIDELHAAVAHGKPPLHDGRWGMATMEACFALLRSARAGREIRLGSH